MVGREGRGGCRGWAPDGTEETTKNRKAVQYERRLLLKASWAWLVLQCWKEMGG